MVSYLANTIRTQIDLSNRLATAALTMGGTGEGSTTEGQQKQGGGQRRDGQQQRGERPPRAVKFAE
jgi:translation initiation factor 3 subunit F